MSQTPNTAAAQRWNGESGLHWVAHRERHEAGHRPLVAHLFEAAGISAGERVLDVGCGCGETTQRAARLTAGLPAGGAPAGDGAAVAPGEPGSAHGLDLSAPMLDMARRLAGSAGLANISFEQGDAQVFAFSPDSYDVVISAFGVMFFSDPAVAFANIAHAVRPGGRLAFLCWQDDRHNEMFSIPVRAFGFDTAPPGQANALFTDPQQVSELLTGAGWSGVRIDPLHESIWLGADAADVMDYMSGSSRVRALATALDDPAGADAAFAAMTQEYRSRERPDGVWASVAAWLVRADRG